MGERTVAFLPRLHTYRANETRLREAALALQKYTGAAEASYVQTDRPEFYGCGEKNLKTIRCPRCGASLSLDWWRGALKAHRESDHFFVLEEPLPCCGKEVSLNDLRYDAPCGFACLCFLLRAPEEGEEAALDVLSERFGVLFRRVERCEGT